MSTNTTSLPIKVEEFTGIIQQAPDMLSKNQNSVAKCNDAGQTLLDTVEGAGGINDDALDASIASFIQKTKVTVKNMNERRSPLTQLLTRVAKEFTSLENEINPTNASSISAKLQKYRNDYAAKKLAEQKALEEAEHKRQAIENEKSEYRIDLSLSLEKHYTNYYNDYSERLMSLFNNIDIVNYEDSAKQIQEFETDYPAKEHFSKFIDKFRAVYITPEDKSVIKQEVVPGLMKDCIRRYSADMQALKDDILLKLPSRKRELEEIELLRKQNAEAAAQAEKAAEERAQAEKAKQEAERKKREEEERIKREAEAAQAEMLASFNQTAAAVETSIPDAKVTKKIQVNNAKGFLEIYQMWFIDEGAKMSIAGLEKIHKRMITYCEKKANKDNELIQSAFVQYVDDVKAK